MEQSFGERLLASAERWGDNVAVREEDGGQTTLAELVSASIRATYVLDSLGVRKGEVFAVLAHNCVSYMNLWQAALLSGSIINPLNQRLAPLELQSLLIDSGAKVLFVDDAHLDLARRIVETVVQQIAVVPLGAAQGGEPSFAALVGAAPSVTPSLGTPDDPSFVIYSGGTTGRPKGALHRHRSALLATNHLESLFEYDETSVFLSIMPMFHVAAAPTIWGLPLVGATARLATFDPTRHVVQIREEGITHLSMAPSLLQAIWKSPECTPEAMRSVQSIGYGGAPMPVAMMELLIEDYPWINLFQIFGMTESAAVLTALTPADHRAKEPKLRSVGRPLPGCELRVVDEHDQPQVVGTPGEVVARAGWLLEEYLNQPQLTEQAWRGGWYHTGDIGVIDQEGYLFLLDRAKDMIITGGENVYSAEVEAAILSHPSVADVAVIGIPSEQWGEQVHAIVVTSESDLTADQVKEHARRSIGGYKVPKTVEFRDAPLPKSATGKTLKRELRAPFWSAERQIS